MSAAARGLIDLLRIVPAEGDAGEPLYVCALGDALGRVSDRVDGNDAFHLFKRGDEPDLERILYTGASPREPHFDKILWRIGTALLRVSRRGIPTRSDDPTYLVSTCTMSAETFEALPRHPGWGPPVVDQRDVPRAYWKIRPNEGGGWLLTETLADVAAEMGDTSVPLQWWLHGWNGETERAVNCGAPGPGAFDTEAIREAVFAAGRCSLDVWEAASSQKEGARYDVEICHMTEAAVEAAGEFDGW